MSTILPHSERELIYGLHLSINQRVAGVLQNAHIRIYQIKVVGVLLTKDLDLFVFILMM